MEEEERREEIDKGGIETKGTCSGKRRTEESEKIEEGSEKAR